MFTSMELNPHEFEGMHHPVLLIIASKSYLDDAGKAILRDLMQITIKVHTDVTNQ